MTTTFFMDGCVSNNDEAVKYFDEIYFPVQDMIDFDNQFQESMQQMVVASDQVFKEDDTLVDDDDYVEAIRSIEEAYLNLGQFVNENANNIKKVKIYNNETELQRAALTLFMTYNKVIETDFSEMLTILKMENPDKENNKRFNTLLKSSNASLNHELQNFYDLAIEYGERYQIDLEFDEE